MEAWRNQGNAAVHTSSSTATATATAGSSTGAGKDLAAKLSQQLEMSSQQTINLLNKQKEDARARMEEARAATANVKNSTRSMAELEMNDFDDEDVEPVQKGKV